MAMVAGSATVKFLEPKHWRGWPTLLLKFFVLTMDRNGHGLRGVVLGLPEGPGGSRWCPRCRAAARVRP